MADVAVQVDIWEFAGLHKASPTREASLLVMFTETGLPVTAAGSRT